MPPAKECDEKYMALALELAEKGRGMVEPNPMVGAVIVKEDEIVGKGYHKNYGGAHAETHAINDAGTNCKGSTLYVTMEPCAHHGKTPPCADAIIGAGIKRVVTTFLDPNPITSGKGLKQLQAAGIEVRMGVMEDQARKINAPFFKLIQKGMPYVIIKWAMSIDGKIATVTGDSKWITSEESRRYVHKIRSQIDGVMVGINTVLKDDPLLTCRFNGGRNPKRIIVDGKASLPLTSALVRTAKQSEIIVGVSRNASPKNIETLRKSGCTVIETKGNNDRVDLRELFLELGAMRLTNIMVEGGSKLITSLLEERLADKIIVFIAPIIIGGDGASPVLGKGVDNICDALKITEVRQYRFSDDVVVEGLLNYR
ncbi:MAG: bifunctional diaminohydroxyphosphoribosylaminopyrimidine deaminase/5-amino-6-(5-phosphoribosylamino)uracil reductase RibD [Planctomycetes bacterium]|nr:bifunctional diaminohydroxyphosphoribosylaminopyrimidine deaminase/5-amino-6-(5-phosphoribosylamino)uracil reductase RibD [Planctomycetota bacterium]